MAFGEALTHTAQNPLFRLYGRIIGFPEFHSHLRWRAIKPYIRLDARQTLEVGAGNGLITFEVAKLAPTMPIFASDIDENQVEEGQKMAALEGHDHVFFTTEDLRQLSSEDRFDQVLVIDVLEHIDRDEEALLRIGRIMESGGNLVISVPTPQFPVYFSRAFHERIGHVRDGYTLEDITDKLQRAGFEVLRHRYHTKKIAGRFATLFYHRTVSAIFYLLLLPIALIVTFITDPFYPPKTAASLVLQAKKI